MFAKYSKSEGAETCPHQVLVIRHKLPGPDEGVHIRLQLHGAIYRPDSFVFILRYCANLKAIRYESTSFNRIVAEKSHGVIAA